MFMGIQNMYGAYVYVYVCEWKDSAREACVQLVAAVLYVNLPSLSSTFPVLSVKVTPPSLYSPIKPRSRCLPTGHPNSLR